MLDTPLSRAPATLERILHDARAVADMCAAAPHAGARRELVVLATEPEPHSGAATFPGVWLNAGTGQFIDRSGSLVSMREREPVVVTEGSYVMLSDPGQRRGRYRWQSPPPEPAAELSRDGIFDPFHEAGTVMCLLDPAAPDGPFGEVRLLPEGWHRHVAEAAARPAAPDVSLAREWIAGDNDLLFARAAATLSGAGQLDVRGARDQAHGYRRAVLHFAGLSSPHTTAHAVSALRADLTGTVEADHRRAAAIGLLAASIFAPGRAASALGGWPARSHPAGLLDPVLTGGDEYIRRAFSLLAPQ